MAVRTVEKRRHGLLTKLNASSPAELILLAIEAERHRPFALLKNFRTASRPERQRRP